MLNYLIWENFLMQKLIKFKQNLSNMIFNLYFSLFCNWCLLKLAGKAVNCNYLLITFLSHEILHILKVTNFLNSWFLRIFKRFLSLLYYILLIKIQYYILLFTRSKQTNYSQLKITWQNLKQLTFHWLLNLFMLHWDFL